MKLELYKSGTCPYCRRVMNAIEESGRTDVALRDIHEDPKNYRTLIKVGGMAQVPCLFIDGEPLYESLDIIAWLESHPQE